MFKILRKRNSFQILNLDRSIVAFTAVHVWGAKTAFLVSQLHCSLVFRDVEIKMTNLERGSDCTEDRSRSSVVTVVQNFCGGILPKLYYGNIDM